MFKRLTIKLLFYLKGLKFYRTTIVPKNNHIKTALFRTESGRTIEFQIYAVEFQKYVYRRGQFTGSVKKGYLIEPVFDPSFPHALTRFNGTRLIFILHHLFLKDDEVLTRILLDAYLEFIQAEIKAVKLKDT